MKIKKNTKKTCQFQNIYYICSAFEGILTTYTNPANPTVFSTTDCFLKNQSNFLTVIYFYVQHL